MKVQWLVKNPLIRFNNPKDHWTLQWKGLNLYRRGRVLKTASFEGSGYLGKANYFLEETVALGVPLDSHIPHLQFSEPGAHKNFPEVFIADTGGWLWCLDLVGECPASAVVPFLGDGKKKRRC